MPLAVTGTRYDSMGSGSAHNYLSVLSKEKKKSIIDHQGQHSAFASSTKLENAKPGADPLPSASLVLESDLKPLLDRIAVLEAAMAKVDPKALGEAQACVRDAASPAREPSVYVAITHDVLSLDDCVRRVADDECGAINTFSGVTRNNFQGKAVVRLEYDAYEPMALKELEKLCRAVLDGSCGSGIRHVACVHRLGVVPNGEASVVIAVSSEHREAGFVACKFVIDELKAKVPIWKKEIYKDGSMWKANKEWEAQIQAGQAVRAVEQAEDDA